MVIDIKSKCHIGKKCIPMFFIVQIWCVLVIVMYVCVDVLKQKPYSVF